MKVLDSSKDSRINTFMFHPLLGNVLIKDIRKIDNYTIAYFLNSFCNINILKKVKDGEG